ncbi:hypothetical protein RR46_15054 [Papilio xuthus]|uniref:Uncharacterized protein n=1 Tax=Papilio xuthus TaxID=66420 RepID=A0A194PKC9_PAPXU|nr:hypothetical protein RR46_15054 [Papilio xuthus]
MADPHAPAGKTAGRVDVGAGGRRRPREAESRRSLCAAVLATTSLCVAAPNIFIRYASHTRAKRQSV